MVGFVSLGTNVLSHSDIFCFKHKENLMSEKLVIDAMFVPAPQLSTEPENISFMGMERRENGNELQIELAETELKFAPSFPALLFLLKD